MEVVLAVLELRHRFGLGAVGLVGQLKDSEECGVCGDGLVDVDCKDIQLSNPIRSVNRRLGGNLSGTAGATHQCKG
jgi:hypothetical protein